MAALGSSSSPATLRGWMLVGSGFDRCKERLGLQEGFKDLKSAVSDRSGTVRGRRKSCQKSAPKPAKHKIKWVSSSSSPTGSGRWG